MSVERDQFKRHLPACSTRYAIVDQYSFPEKDTTERICHNGVSHAIYACDGTISRTLPLHMYPRYNEVHPQILRSSIPDFQVRDPVMALIIQQNQLDRANKRLEGFYTE
jgi:hypothetical protein